MVSPVNTFSSYSYAQYFSRSSSKGDKLYVPVAQNQLMYSYFEHVRGFVSPQKDSGVSIDKIAILNTLIEQLASIKQNPAATTSPASQNLTETQIDSMIKDYQGQIKTALATAQTNPYALSGSMAQPGALFNIAA